MVFCGHCGYQLAPGDKTCPRCGAEVGTDLTSQDQDPEVYNATEMSQVVQDVSSPRTTNKQGRQSATPMPQPLVLGPSGASYSSEQMANDATTMMNASAYHPPQQSYPTYPPQANMGMYGYNAGGQAYYQGGQSAMLAQLLESSRKGKTTALLLILFGLLLLIAAIAVFLLNQQGIIFSS